MASLAGVCLSSLYRSIEGSKHSTALVLDGGWELLDGGGVWKAVHLREWEHIGIVDRKDKMGNRRHEVSWIQKGKLLIHLNVEKGRPLFCMRRTNERPTNLGEQRDTRRSQAILGAKLMTGGM